MKHKFQHNIFIFCLVSLLSSCLNTMVYTSNKSFFRNAAVTSTSVYDERARFDNYRGNYSTGTNPYSVFSADLDGDGDMDLMSADGSSNQVSIRFNDGVGNFGVATTYATGADPNTVFSIDLDGDGDFDLMSAEYTSGQISVRFNDGIGGFGPVTAYAMGAGTISVYSVDLDGDGDNDLMSADDGADQVSIRFNDGIGNFGAATTYMLQGQTLIQCIA